MSQAAFSKIYPITFYRQCTDTLKKSRPCPFPLNQLLFLPSSSLLLLPPPIFCLSHHQTKISVMKTSAGQLVRGLEMEIEKLKGSERSVCARITAHFITGRNGQIWHEIKKGEKKKTLSAMYFCSEKQQRSVI